MRVAATLVLSIFAFVSCRQSTPCKPGDLSCEVLTSYLFRRFLVSRFLYMVSQNGSSIVSMYSINERTGLLTPLSPATVAAGNTSGFIKIDPNARFAFVDDVGTNVYTYSVNQLTGQLTQVAVTGNGPNSNPFVVDPRSTFAFGTSNGSTTINIYSYNAGTGTVSLLSTATNTGATATQQTILDSQGRYLYTSNQTSANVSQFSVNAATGALTSLGAAIGATQPGAICMDPLDRYLYAPNTGGASIAAFSIGSTGVLSTIGPTVTPAATFYCTVTPDSSYVLATGAAMYVLPVNSNGGLGTPSSFGGTASSVTLDASGQFAYVTNGTSNIDVYRFSNGTLTLIQTVTSVATTAELKVLNLYTY